MSRPIIIHKDDHSERAEMMRKAFEQAFNECWYCEDELATATKFGQKICDTCSSKGKEIRTSAPTHLMDEEDKAWHLRVCIYMCEVGRKAKEVRPNEM